MQYYPILLYFWLFRIYRSKFLMKAIKYSVSMVSLGTLWCLHLKLLIGKEKTPMVLSGPTFHTLTVITSFWEIFTENESDIHIAVLIFYNFAKFYVYGFPIWGENWFQPLKKSPSFCHTECSRTLEKIQGMFLAVKNISNQVDIPFSVPMSSFMR